MSIASLNDDGFEPMAVASLATLIGTGQAVEPCTDLTALGELFDPEKVSKSDAKLDMLELSGLNEKLLHDMAYSAAQPRLTKLDCDLGEPFWLAVRANLNRFNDVQQWRDVVEGKFEPADMDAEDAAFVKEAAALLPNEPWGDDVWTVWTSAAKERSGRKGRALFMPLRKALTGLDHGPDLGQLLPVIGWEGTRRRLP